MSIVFAVWRHRTIAAWACQRLLAAAAVSVCADFTRFGTRAIKRARAQEPGKVGESAEQIISQADKSCPKGHKLCLHMTPHD